MKNNIIVVFILILIVISCNNKGNEKFENEMEYIIKGDYKNAIELGKNKLKIDSTNYITLNAVGFSYSLDNQFDSAIPYFKKSIFFSEGKFHEPFLNLAVGYFKKNDTFSSLSNFQKAYKLKPNDKSVLYNFARFAESITDFNTARIFYQKIIDKNENYKDAKFRLDSQPLKSQINI